MVVDAVDGQRVRFVGVVRWSDFDLFGAAQRERAMRAAGYFMRLMAATRGGQPFDAEAVRAEGLADRAWLDTELTQTPQGRWDRTVVVTHFAPSLRSADPRYGRQPGTASFCNADDDLIPRADLWLHGHLHCRHDYGVSRPGRAPDAGGLPGPRTGGQGRSRRPGRAASDRRLTAPRPAPAQGPTRQPCNT
jgi:hypothetical protein